MVMCLKCLTESKKTTVVNGVIVPNKMPEFAGMPFFLCPRCSEKYNLVEYEWNDSLSSGENMLRRLDMFIGLQKKVKI